jgi:hypothetical protein
VQEHSHLGRALAAEVLWRGELPDYASAARAVTKCDPGEAVRIGDLLLREQSLTAAKPGGSNACPRFWSWPENARARREVESILSEYDRLAARHEALDVNRAFLALSVVGLKSDFARETAALVGRAMLRKGLQTSPLLDQAMVELERAADLARSLEGKGAEFHRRYCEGLSERSMVRSFEQAAKGPSELLDRLRRFRAAPSPETWPFARFSLQLDAIVVDPCAHHIELSVSKDGETFNSVYSGGFRISSAEVGNTSIMSFPVEEKPRFVRLEVGGFACLAFTRVRLESLEGTQLPIRVVRCEGEVRDPEHLLEFDNKTAVFNRSDIMSNWLSLTPLPKNFVVLEFE